MGFPVCPDSGPHWLGGGPGAPAVQGLGLTSLYANALAQLQQQCWLCAAAWHGEGGGAALWPWS